MAGRVGTILLGLLILAGAAVVDAYFYTTRPEPKPVARPDVAPTVEVRPLDPSEVRLAVRTHGTVEPRTETTLSAEVGGRIVETSPALAAGGVAADGEVLARIDRRDYELALTRARALLAQARARLAVEKATAELAREEFKEFGKGEPDPLVLREPQIRETEAAVAAAEAGLEQAERDLARTEVKAPYAARIRRRHVAGGQRVSPGEPVAVLYPLDAVEIRLPVPQEDTAHLDLPLSPGVEAADGPLVVLRAKLAGRRAEWTGRIVRIEGEVDPKTRMIQAVARVDDPFKPENGDPPLLVGLFVEAEIRGRTVADAYEVPRASLRECGLLVVDQDGRLRLRQVERVRDGLRTAVVRSGVQPGDRLIVSPVDAPVDGMRVRVAE